MTASSLPEKPRSLCRELTIALAALASVVSVIAILLNYAYFSLEAESLHERKTSEYAVSLQDALELPLWNADDSLIGKIASAFSVNDEVAQLTIRDQKQRVVYHQEKSSVYLPRREITVKHNGQKIGSVEIGLSLKTYKESGRLALLAGISTLVLLIVVLLCAMRWLLSGLLKKPIDGFIAATSNMVEGKYGQIELPVSYAEFVPILSGFKIMSDAVATRESSLQRINENLSAEIDVRKGVEAALRASEERWQFALEGAGDGVWDWDMQTDKTTFSKRWKEMLGYAEDEFEDSFEAWKQSLHPDDLENTLGELQNYFDGKSEIYRVEFRMRCKDGGWKWILARGKLVVVTRQPLRMIGTHTDISERKAAEQALHRLNRELRAISNCNQVLMRVDDEQALLYEICKIICHEAGYRMAWVGYAESDTFKTVRPIAWAGAEGGYLKAANISWADTERGQGPAGLAIRSGVCACIQDFAVDPQVALWRDLAMRHGYRSCISLPLKHENTVVFGALTIYSSEPNAFTADEMRLLEELANDMAFGITVLRARADQKQAEAVRTHLAAIVEYSNDAIIGKTTDGVITHWNKGAERIYGYSAEEVIGQSITMLAPVAHHAEIHLLLAKIRQGEIVVSHEAERIRKDGVAIHVSLTLSPIKDASGNITGISTIARDITEKKRVEERLHQANAYNRSLIEASLDPLVTISPEGKITDVNRATEGVTGRRRSELIGTDFSDYFTEPAQAREVYQQVFENSFVTDYPLAIRHKDGHITDVLYNASVYRDEAGVVLGVFAAARDVTERRKAEQELARLSLRNRLILDSAGEGVYGLDSDGRCTFINPTAAQFLGYSVGELLGQHTHAMFHHTKPDGKPYAQEECPVHAAYKHGVIHRGSDLYWRKDGSCFPVDYVCTPMHEAGSVGAVVMFSDITERKQTEEQLRRYKDHLEEEVEQRTADLVLARNAAEAANQAKSAFLASMSHEFRTPLNAILGFSSMMRKDRSLPESQQQNLEIINRSGEHLLTLINDVLEMAKIEAGRVQLENAAFDLGGMVRDVTDMMQLRAKERGLQLLIDQSSTFPRYIVGDEARLRQVLINLLGNAVKFTREGGVTLRLGTRNNKVSHLLIEVEDSGPGIALEDQQRIFEPFVQLGVASDSKGTGLGLSITRQFVQLMGGIVSLESAPGQGSLFIVDLPLIEVTDADIAKPQELDKGEVLGLEPGQPAYRILIVEDQLENQLLLTRLMESVGFQVKVAENGEEGVLLFQRWRPHFIWMDRRMPVMDGLEATRAIRALPGGTDVKIVAVTASAFKEQRNESLAAGMDDFVRKPYRFNEIYECLSKQLGVRYIYAGKTELKQPVMALTPEKLAGLPEGLRRELKAALESLENTRIAQVIDRIAELDPQLRKTLANLAENFDYPAILKALQANRPET